ncbi:MAG: ABC transporter permease [Paracoccaceae bacterium]|nr:ABC transporter permease [Paracoccaceae bacterium]
MPDKKLEKTDPLFSNALNLNPEKREFQFVPRLEVRQNSPEWLRLVIYALSLLVGCVSAIIVMSWAGVKPDDLIQEISALLFSGTRTIASILAQTAPLVIAGLATAAAFRANFWNVGLEGQMILGTIFASFIAIYDVGPDSIRLLLMALAAMLGGIIWIAPAGFLKLKLGINEVITTLLLNYVAFNLLLHLLFGPWKDPVSGFPHSAQFDQVERLPHLGWENLTYTLPLALLLVLVTWWFFTFSRAGYLINFVKSNPNMAKAVGVPVLGLSITAIIMSGAIGGLTGFAIASGIEFRMTRDFFSGFLFSGVLIAFLGRNNPIGVAVVALFMAMLVLLGQSLQVFYQVPFALIQLIQAIFIICVAASEFFLTYRMHWRK